MRRRRRRSRNRRSHRLPPPRRTRKPRKATRRTIARPRIHPVPVGLGPRFLIEAGFIIAVAVVAGVERFRTTTIVLVVGAAWLLVAVVEFFSALARKRVVGHKAAGPEERPAAVPAPSSDGLQPEHDTGPAPDLEPGPSPEPEQ